MDINNISYKPLKRVYSVCAFLVLICLTFLIIYQFSKHSISVQSRTAQKISEKEKIKFINKANSFLIENSEVFGEELKLTLKNNYERSINAFYITVGPKENGVSYNIELLYSEVKDAIRPGESFTCRLSYDKQLQINGFVLQAVLFSDNSGDGETDFIQRMKDVRQGEKAIFGKGLELLKNQKNLIFEDFSKLEALKSEIASLEVKEDKKSSDYNYGLSSGKENLIRYLEKIQKRVGGMSKPVDANPARRRLRPSCSIFPVTASI